MCVPCTSVPPALINKLPCPAARLQTTQMQRAQLFLPRPLLTAAHTGRSHSTFATGPCAWASRLVGWLLHQSCSIRRAGQPHTRSDCLSLLEQWCNTRKCTGHTRSSTIVPRCAGKPVWHAHTAGTRTPARGLDGGCSLRRLACGYGWGACVAHLQVVVGDGVPLRPQAAAHEAEAGAPSPPAPAARCPPSCRAPAAQTLPQHPAACLPAACRCCATASLPPTARSLPSTWLSSAATTTRPCLTRS